MGYQILNEKSSAEYVQHLDLLSQKTSWESTEIGDGNINLVFRLREKSSGQRVVVKQALPYVRCVGEEWPLDLGRAAREGKVLQIQNELAPGLVPEVYRIDEDMALIVMEDLSDLGVMRAGTIRMKKYPLFPDHISTFMANVLFYTSDLHQDPKAKKNLVKEFINPDLCRITEDLIFTDPYYDCQRNNVNPKLRPYLKGIFWRKKALRLEVSNLKYKFLTAAEALVHGDLHTGSIFADETRTKVFDPEFAFFGPIAFDPGLLVGNLLINYVSWDGKDSSTADIRAYRSYLVETIHAIYGLFEKKFRVNWGREAGEVIASVDGFLEGFMRRLFVDMVGYAGAVMIRRVHGLAHNVDVDEIEDLEQRRDVQIHILELGEDLIMNRRSFSHIEDLTGFVERRTRQSSRERTSVRTAT